MYVACNVTNFFKGAAVAALAATEKSAPAREIWVLAKNI